MWFAFILVSLNHWKQHNNSIIIIIYVVICFHFSIFEPLETAQYHLCISIDKLWFAFILVSLNHWKQLISIILLRNLVVICFHFSIFEPLETAGAHRVSLLLWLWFAFILVSLNHWKQLTSSLFVPIFRCDLLSF